MTAGGRPDATRLLALAVAVAHEAGRLLVERRPPGRLAVASTKTSETDVVTAMDTAAERLVVERLLAARPDDGVLGEEGAARRGTSGVEWVVDPIDGTVNYLYRIPQYAVSIAARLPSLDPIDDAGDPDDLVGSVVVGVVHNPASGETFTAVRGGGALLDGAPIAVSVVDDVSQALVGTGFGYTAGRRAVQARVARDVIPRVRDIRRMGAASLDLCAVACGRLDAYYEQGLKPWDLAAGGLVAREAGAVVTGPGGRPAGEDLVLAAPPALVGPLSDMIGGITAES